MTNHTENAIQCRQRTVQGDWTEHWEKARRWAWLWAGKWIARYGYDLSESDRQEIANNALDTAYARYAQRGCQGKATTYIYRTIQLAASHETRRWIKDRKGFTGQDVDLDQIVSTKNDQAGLDWLAILENLPESGGRDLLVNVAKATAAGSTTADVARMCNISRNGVYAVRTTLARVLRPHIQDRPSRRPETLAQILNRWFYGTAE